MMQSESESSPQAATIPEPSWAENRAKKAVDLRLARESVLLKNLVETQTDLRSMARGYNRKMIFGKEDADMRADESEGDALGDIKVGDTINYYQTVAQPDRSTPVAAPTASAPTASAPTVPVSGMSTLAKVGTVLAAGALAGGIPAMAITALGLLNKPAAPIHQTVEPDSREWQMEVIPQGGGDASIP
jgi:hypothetical protein